MKNLEPNARKLTKFLTKNDKAYVDSVPKEELPQLENMITAPKNEGQILRLFIGASENIPSRAIGYVASALVIAEVMPVEQVQIVSVASLGAAINGTDIKRVNEEFESFARFSCRLLRDVGLANEIGLSFVSDTEESTKHISEFTEASIQAISKDQQLKSQLTARSSKHGGNVFEYTAGHFVYQDTNLLEIQKVYGSEPIEASKVVSVGCLQEKIFYKARNLMKEETGTSILMPTVQVFTLHSSAPYFEANLGEQMLRTAVDTKSICFVSSNEATQRDLNHLKNIINGEQNEK